MLLVYISFNIFFYLMGKVKTGNPDKAQVNENVTQKH